MTERAVIHTLRKRDTANAIVFLHGFGGTPTSTWAQFPDLLMADPALELYMSAYEESVKSGQPDQAFYHGINVCFLWAADAKRNDVKVREMAAKVLEHCDQAGADIWSLGTR